MKHLLTGILLLLAPLAWAQTERQVTPVALQPELQAEFALNGNGRGDYLLLELRGLRLTDNTNPSTRLGFDERQLRLGAEHFWSEHWSGGATARLVGDGYSSELVLEPLLRHRGPVGPLLFGQRLSFERAIPINQHYLGGPGPAGRNYLRLRLDLEKQLPAGALTLRPRLSYDVASQFRFQKEDTDRRLRTIGAGSLRGEIGLRFSAAFDLTPWFAYQTQYLYTLPQYNSSGQQVRGGNVNSRTPLIGLDVRFTLLPQRSASADRIQLPTQH